MSFLYVPVVTSLAGGGLTSDNWSASGIQMVACSLQSLLTRPGENVLKDFASLKSYLGWSKDLLIDARLPKANTREIYEWHSPYDGKKIQISTEELSFIIDRIDCDKIILPQNDSSLNQANMHSPLRVLQSNHALCNEANLLLTRENIVLNKDVRDPEETVWISHASEGNTSLVQTHLFYLLTDFPAAQALLGQMYSEGVFIDLLDAKMAQQFEVIDEHCGCPTCKTGLTRAYLHYLFQSTPLLCQRFLIQHNVYMFRSLIEMVSAKASLPS